MYREVLARRAARELLAAVSERLARAVLQDNRRQNVVDQERGSLGHAPAHARAGIPTSLD